MFAFDPLGQTHQIDCWFPTISTPPEKVHTACENLMHSWDGRWRMPENWTD
jgi:hypothetical protein